MKSLRIAVCLIALAATASNAGAQNVPGKPAQPANPLIEFNRMVYDRLQGILLASAEKMPEENYAFKPTDAVRSYGQILGHVADAQYLFCSIAAGEKNPGTKIEETKSSKADLIAALKDAFAYCNKVYEGVTDASSTQTVKLFGGDTPRLGVLTVNSLHSIEHYGNLVTYMRLKNIVPPTSEPGFRPSASGDNQQPKK